MSTTLNQETLKSAFVLRTNDQMEMLRESESRSLFIRVIQRVSSFQKGTANVVFESSSSSTSGSAAATCCGTATCQPIRIYVEFDRNIYVTYSGSGAVNLINRPLTGRVSWKVTSPGESY